jgi:hypothetical protein
MQSLKPLHHEWTISRPWRHGLALLAVFAPLAFLLSMSPIVDSPAYHDFADRRTFFLIPNFLDVVSSFPYLLVGIAGLNACRGMRPSCAGPAWIVFFAGIVLVGAGSAWYHSNPNSGTLVWDRLPMTLGFTGLFVAIVTDYISPRLGAALLVPTVLVGLASVIFGHGYDDLRLYAWVQSLPLLVIPAAVLLYRPTYTRRCHLLLALVLYGLAKFAELYDPQVFVFTAEIVSGHTLKHILGALAIWVILRMLRKRILIAGKAIE